MLHLDAIEGSLPSLQLLCLGCQSDGQTLLSRLLPVHRLGLGLGLGLALGLGIGLGEWPVTSAPIRVRVSVRVRVRDRVR